MPSLWAVWPVAWLAVLRLAQLFLKAGERKSPIPPAVAGAAVAREMPRTATVRAVPVAEQLVMSHVTREPAALSRQPGPS